MSGMVGDLEVVNALADAGLRAGVVAARGVAVTPADAGLAAELDRAVARAAGAGEAPLKGAVREMLRRGGYKPAGRGKPASEYLAQAASEGRFPRINNLVDVNNLVSLATGLPISLLDLARTTERVTLRLGAAGESYVFNAAGQTIDLAGLIVACRREADGATVPLGNPVKDAMAGKITETTRDVAFCVYAPRAAVNAGALTDILAQLEALARAHGRSGRTAMWVG
jgi:DNA/RNA-binding domain of Phe-tRNA-synthetase-like protein